MIKGKLPQYDGRKIKNKGINFNKCTDIIDYSWKCMKCGNTEFEKDQFQLEGTLKRYLMSKIKSLLQ